MIQKCPVAGMTANDWRDLECKRELMSEEDQRQLNRLKAAWEQMSRMRFHPETRRVTEEKLRYLVCQLQGVVVPVRRRLVYIETVQDRSPVRYAFDYSDDKYNVLKTLMV